MSDKPGPFSVHTNEYGKQFLQYEIPGVLWFSKMLPMPQGYLEYLAEWLNELWTEREAGR